MDAKGPLTRDDTLADKAYDRLRTALMTGSFRPGDTLSIRSLAGTLGISATPARDAISRILWERGLNNGPHRTVIVPKLDLERLREIYDVRLATEGLAAEMAASRFGAEDLKRVRRAQSAHLTAVDGGKYAEALEQNEAFHFAIYERAGNATLLEVIQGLWLRLGPSLNLLYPMYDKSRRGVEHHSAIVDALKRRDPALARSTVENDLRDGWAELERAIAATGA